MKSNLNNSKLDSKIKASHKGFILRKAVCKNS